MRAAPLLLSLLAAVSRGARVTIDNTKPRLDVTGAIMDAHDCSIRRLPNGSFVMHAIEYGLCVAPTGQGCDSTPDHCGFRDTHNVTVWLSPDLSSGSWVRVGDAFPLAARPASLIFRPDAIFCPATGLWVLWYNDAGRGNIYVSSTSASPFGPFTGFATTNVTDATWSGGDFHLFYDETEQQGYVIWTGMSKLPGYDHKIRISKLTSDFLGVTSDEPYMFNDNAPSTTFNEAPAIFSKGGVYYTGFSHCCCFCYQGSGLFVHTAPHPMGPWTAATAPYDIACEAPPADDLSASYALSVGGIPTPGQGCLYGGSKDVSVTRSQQDFMATLPDGAGGFTYLYIGGRWGQSPDGLKGHEPQYVYPLQFNADGSIQHIQWNDTVTFDIEVAAT